MDYIVCLVLWNCRINLGQHLPDSWVLLSPWKPCMLLVLLQPHILITDTSPNLTVLQVRADSIRTVQELTMGALTRMSGSVWVYFVNKNIYLMEVYAVWTLTAWLDSNGDHVEVELYLLIWLVQIQKETVVFVSNEAPKPQQWFLALVIVHIAFRIA